MRMAENYDFLRSFTFDGKETSHLFQIAKVNIPFLSKDNDFFTVGNTDGKHFRNTRLGEYTLSIDGFIITDNSGMSVSETKDELVKIINTDEPKELILDLFPDRYFSAIFTGTEEYDATDTKYTPLTLTFDVPDSLAHAINPAGFTNVKSGNMNLIYDSEFTKIDQYLKPWVKVLPEKRLNSTVIGADFTSGIPFDYDKNSTKGQAWFQMNQYTRRMISDLKVGDRVVAGITFKGYVDSDDADIAGRIVVEEWGDAPLRILKRHTRDIPKGTTEWTHFFLDVRLESPNVKGINFQYSAFGSEFSVAYARPYMYLNPVTTGTYYPSEFQYNENITIQNKGTYKSYPTYTFKMNSDNGFCGLVDGKGNVLQFGYPAEQDYIEKTKVETVKTWSFWGNRLPSEFKINEGFVSSYPNYAGDISKPNIFDGSIDMSLDPNSATPVFGSANDQYWHGPSMVAVIPPSSTNDRTLNFTANIRFNFKYSYSPQAMGRVEFNLVDTAGEYVMGAVFRDSTTTSDNILIEIVYQGKVVHTQTFDKKKFANGWREINLERLGDKLVWRLCSIKSLNQFDNVVIKDEYKYTINEKNTQQIYEFGTWFQRWRSNLHILMDITDAKMRWKDTPYLQDVKNVFQNGDLVTIDTETRTLYVNGTPNVTLNTLGNDWEKFVLPVGETVIKPVFSDFALTPEVSVSVNERYL
jgi:predicted phage tail component-like protein